MIRLRIYTPSGTSEHTAWAVFLPGTAGAFEVLQDHAPLVSTLAAGTVRWRTPDGLEEQLQIRSGVVRLAHNEMYICAE